MLENKKISIVIIDDHPVVQEGLKNILENDDNLTVSACFSTANDAKKFLSNHEADIILLDVSLPDIHGSELCGELKKLYPKTIILVLSNHTERSIIMQMLQNGANGYLLKNITASELLKCIQEASEGEITFSSEVKKIITLPPEMGEISNIPKLTKRELEIIKLIASGNTTLTIADKLFVSPLTIETHRRNLLQKFKVKNVAELLTVVIKNNII